MAPSRDLAKTRPLTTKETGWFRAFVGEPSGAIQLPGGREVRVRARRVRGERLLDAIDQAYAEKYDTRASCKWVVGFARPKRRGTTIEFVPRSRGARTAAGRARAVRPRS